MHVLLKTSVPAQSLDGVKTTLPVLLPLSKRRLLTQGSCIAYSLFRTAAQAQDLRAFKTGTPNENASG